MTAKLAANLLDLGVCSSTPVTAVVAAHHRLENLTAKFVNGLPHRLRLTGMTFVGKISKL